jgi:HEAT repeat protein
LRAATALLDPSRPDGRAVEPLAATLRAPRTSPGERAAVATLLGRTGAPRAATELAGLVTSKDTTLRLAAIDALGALGSAGSADDALVPLLIDPDPAVRLHTAVALAASGGMKARSALLGKLEGGDEVDRYAVLSALGGILERNADEGAAARLFKELAVAAGPERDAILEAVGRAKLPSVLRALGELVPKADVDDRRMIAAVLAAHRGAPAAVTLARTLANDADGGVRAQAAFTLGALGDAGVLPVLATLAKSGDADVAADAAGGVARQAATSGRAGQAAIVGAACPMLSDGRATVRANALVALSFVEGRCADGRTERKLLADDANDLVRAAAARAISSAPGADDRAALDRCVSADRSGEVARLCRPRPTTTSAVPPRPPRAVTVYVVGETGASAKPRAAFLLEYEGGILRAGVADRRGATFEAAAPAGEIALRRAPAR